MKQKLRPVTNQNLPQIENKLLSATGSLGEESRVQARFLLGPAGSGKTFRCLAGFNCLTILNSVILF
jgi:hypothetical protein